MHALHRYTLMAALALGVFPVTVPAGEAPATSAAAQRESEKQLAEAQQQLDAAARRVAELSTQMGRRFNLRLGNELNGGPPPRVLLGVSVDNSSSRDGARVMEVSPGGAAAEVGMKIGDIITGIADLDLTKDSDPSRALVEKLNQLQPDQKVKVAVLRDGKKMSFDIAPRPAPQGMVFLDGQRLPLGNIVGNQPNQRGQGPSLPGGERGRGAGSSNGGPGPDGNVRQPFQAQPGRNGAGGRDGPQAGLPPLQRIERQLLEIQSAEADTRFGGAELASLSERLGSYFGVKQGVLVVRAGADSQFKLQDGDVLLAIDGREISSAQQAGRILRSYQPGEKLKLKVQRDRKVQDLEITAPGGRRPN